MSLAGFIYAAIGGGVVILGVLFIIARMQDRAYREGREKALRDLADAEKLAEKRANEVLGQPRTVDDSAKRLSDGSF